MRIEAEDVRETNAHTALWASESYVSAGERAYYAWLRKVEKKLGHSLDGDQDADGYSLDYAMAAFDAGASVDGYLAEVQADQADIKNGFCAWPAR